MDKSQIESTINEIRKRSGTVTVFISIIFTIGILLIPSNFAFSEENNESQTNGDFFCFNCKLNGLHIVIEIGIAVLIPVIYSKMQKQRKRKSIIKIWKSKKDALESISLSTLNNGAATLDNVVFELSKIENQVAESFNDVDYLAYALRIRALNELIVNRSDRKYVLDWLKEWLDGLVLMK